ncbi:uncharacterized protein [Penaeus vannamei]|uniref:uncharacterized protein n=1 Tax=Penaeus vannamei TaxID=6689 RepID=UPI00387F9D6C
MGHWVYLTAGILLLARSVMGGCESKGSSVTATLLTGDYYAYSCADASQTWDDDFPVYVSTCGPDQMNDTKSCSSPSSTFSSCDGDPLPPLGEPTSSAVPDDAARRAVFYQCPAGKAFLSGAYGQLSQCRRGKWTPVLDMCDEACSVARDCQAVADLGFTTSGEYRIVPSGRGSDPPIKLLFSLKCLL